MEECPRHSSKINLLENLLSNNYLIVFYFIMVTETHVRKIYIDSNSSGTL